MFIKDLKTVRENVNLKIEELKVDMVKEIAALDHNYSSLHKKVDIIFNDVTKVVEWYTSLLPNVKKKVEVDVQSFGKINKTLDELKELISKSGSSSSSLLTPEIHSEKLHLLSLPSTMN